MAPHVIRLGSAPKDMQCRTPWQDRRHGVNNVFLAVVFRTKTFQICEAADTCMGFIMSALPEEGIAGMSATPPQGQLRRV